MSEVIITYENLYEILRREKYRTELQKVETTFFRDVVKYLKEKKAILDSQAKKDSIFASTELEKTQTQLRNVQKILKELYEKRENKIIQFALFSSRSDNPPDTSNMLPEELALYKSLKDTLDGHRNGILMNILHSKMPDIDVQDIIEEQKPLKTEDKTNTFKVRALGEIPEFVGPDMEVYGPFQKDEVLSLPESIANFLIQSKQVENENT